MKKITLLLTLSVLLLSTMIAPVMAGATDVAIQVGDWFEYQARITQWISEAPFLPEGYMGPLTLADNQTNSIRYTVTAITPTTEPATGNNVTFTVTYNWKNGTVTEGTLVEHVSTKNQNIFMIGANMNAPDKISDTFDFLGMGIFDYPERVITRTFNYTNPTATRATNECNYTVEIFGSPYDNSMWWDKETGMRVYYESHGNVVAFGESPAHEYTLIYELVDSNIEDLPLIPEALTPILMLLSTAAVIAGALCLRKQPRIIKI